MPTIRFLSPVSLPKIGHEVQFDVESVTLGSSPLADIVLREPSVSPLHARLSQREGRLYLEDLGSENGLYIGATRVKSYLLDYEQLFRIGRVALQIIADVVPESATAQLTQLPDVAPRLNPPSVVAVTATSRHSRQSVVKRLAQLKRSKTGQVSEAQELQETAPLPLVSSKRLTAQWLEKGTIARVRAPSTALAWLVSTIAVTVTASVFVALPFKAKLTAMSRLGLPYPGQSKEYVVGAGDAERRISLDKQAELLVPSAAVTDSIYVTVTRAKKSRLPSTKLFRANGQAFSVAIDQPSKLDHPLQFRSVATKSDEPARLLGSYNVATAQYTVSLVGAGEGLQLSGSTDVVPLSLSEQAKAQVFGRYLMVTKAGTDQDLAVAEMARARLDKIFDEFGRLEYPLPRGPILVVLDDAALGKRVPLCSGFVPLSDEPSKWSDAGFERAAFSVVAQSSLDCGRVDSGRRVLGSLFEVLARASTLDDFSAIEVGKLPRAVAPWPTDRETLDVGREFLSYITEDERTKSLLLLALSRRQPTLVGAAANADAAASAMAWVAEAVEEVTGQTLNARWEQFLDQSLINGRGKMGPSASCPVKAALRWEALPEAFSARILCSPVYAMGG